MKKHYSLILCMMMFVVFSAEKILLQNVNALHNFDFIWLPAIPILFVVMGLFAIHKIYFRGGNNVSWLMGLKAFRILVSLILILLYAFVVKDNAISFLISYLVYYMTYLGFETYLLMQVNNKEKNKI